IYAFEPNTETLKFLKKNIENNPIKNITLYEKAAYSSNTKLKFLAANQEGNSGGSHIIKDLQHGFAGKEVEVEAVALDSVLPSDISIDVIQMDVEGAEADAIFGAERIIDASPNLVVIQEWTPKWMKKDVEKYLSFWRKRGYKFARIADDDLHEMSDEDLTNSDQADIVILKDLESLKRKIFSK
ncbi:MAG: FkbM family methyltransferase, partial [Rickettsiaceae bacterium]|nr:FkbM family methyltransferase [Rickettsiaceae bacterium]